MTYALLSLERVCREMQTVNIMVRNRDLQKGQSLWFYEVKNALIKYLYQNGYSVEVKLSKQIFYCWTCEGEGCYRCDDTGIHHTVLLYAFKFKIPRNNPLVGRREFYLRWHMPQERVDWPMNLTENNYEPYRDPDHQSLELEKGHVVSMLFHAWLYLSLHGVKELPALGIGGWLKRNFHKWMYFRIGEFGDWLEAKQWKHTARQIYEIKQMFRF